MGDIAEQHLRKASPGHNQAELESRLCSWIKNLPLELKLYDFHPVKRLRPYKFEIRQLHVAYFAALAIMNHPRNSNEPPSAVAILASSLVAGIFDEFLIRDEVRYLGPIFTFHLLAVSLVQLRCHQYAPLRESALANLQIIARAQMELEKKWPSAAGSQRVYSKIRDRIIGQNVGLQYLDAEIGPSQRLLLEDYGEELSNQWHLFLDGAHMEGNDLGNNAQSEIEPAIANDMSNMPLILDESLSMLGDSSHQSFGMMEADFDQYRSFVGGDIGNWLLWDETT